MKDKNVFEMGQRPARGNKTMFFFLLYIIVVQIVVYGIFVAIGWQPESLLTVGIMQVFGIFIPFLFYLLFTRQKHRDVLKWTTLGRRNTLYLVVITLATIPIIQVISRLSAIVFFPVISEFMLDLPTYSIWLSLIVVAVFPAFFEEFFIRGAIFAEYKKLPIIKIALITGLFFGIMHLNFHQAIYAGMLGVLWAYIRYYTRTIWGPILMHFLNNAIFVLLSYSETYSNWYTELWATPLRFLLVWGGIALVLFPVLVVCFKKIRIGHAMSEAIIDVSKTEQNDGDKTEQDDGEKTKIFTWAFWVVVVIFLLFGSLVEIGVRMI